MRLKNSILLATLFAVAAVNVKIVLDTNRAYDLSMTSIKALSNEPEKEGGNSGNNNPESNNEGSGPFFYKHLLGKPKICTLYRNEHITGKIIYSEQEMSGDLGWTSSKVPGLVEKCPDKGNGCTAYSCMQTNK